MKASVITALTWAACTMAGPIGLRDVAGEDCTCEIETVTITVPAPTEVGTIGGPTNPPGTATWSEPAEPNPNTNTGTATGTVTATATATATETWTNTVTATGTATGPATVPPTSAPTPCDDEECHGTGHLIQDLGPQVNRALTVTGADGERFLVQVNEDVYNLLSGRVSLSDSIGEIVGDAATIGDLIADLGPIIDCILTIVGEDSHILLVRLAPEVADLLRGTGVTLGLDAINNPIGGLLGSLTGGLLTRDEAQPLTVTGQSGHDLPVALDGVVGNTLRENNVSGPIGTVIAAAISVTQLLQHPLAQDSEDLIVVIGRDTGALLIRLAPGVARLLDGLLPGIATPVGRIIAVIGDSL
ncbi:hypothetical protein AN4575.2 [Aspergillus nidulans FGSC A4]|uniref:Uncharacterized protein n=1 Tax=Emericella nidulans (strain FGSC A4 / ATCC 38163 / CBS 112.46 / NRRL 194 / M139) TaxID=227321 RepID=Q5B4F5_EMENI|nr:hypothetical protein [Aspergillus nidulans FGSC A4]EAA60918.1 hypothetical protein AN4575.2 [Aspergillus nidulans FGSC A4]CBF77224.1 TPA: hypothetical protein ANIA_04575 [Aspergillus nidulans FGSC A4]|eukprot:XP_662179.1 hypothetical protein AN4575.2 [Aspergillus nidulans FGSC A4]